MNPASRAGLIPPDAVAVSAGADTTLRRWWRDLGPIVQFCIIYEQHGVTGAAEHLGLAKSTVSETLARFEALRGRLFDRDTWQPTALGEYLYRHTARPILAAIRQADLDGSGDGPLLTLAASEYMIQQYLAPVIAAFRLQVPNLRVELRSGHRREREAMLASRTVDLAIVTVDRPDPSFVAHELLRVAVTLLVPRSCPAPTAAEFLARPPFPYALACPPATESAAQLFLNHLDQRRVPWTIKIGASCSALMPFIVAGGNAFGPCVRARSLIEHEGVRELPLTGIEPLTVVALSRGAPSPLLRKLLATLDEVARTLRASAVPGAVTIPTN